jgi:PKHD-type hydroxylase
MNQLWQLWTQGLSEQEVDEIVSHCEQHCTMSDAKIGFKGENNSAHRHSKVGWVDVNYNSFGKQVKEKLFRFADIANRNAFGFDINYLNDVQYTVYNGTEQDRYDWHIDTFWANQTAYDRKVSLIIQLTNPDEYEGGLFQFEPELPQPVAQNLKKRGTVLVFPSFLRHRVTPVTSGVRRSLVAWVEGPKFK